MAESLSSRKAYVSPKLLFSAIKQRCVRRLAGDSGSAGVVIYSALNIAFLRTGNDAIRATDLRPATSIPNRLESKEI